MLLPKDMTITELQDLIFQTNKNKGWFDEERTFGDDIALIHTEVSEAFEAYRDRGLEDWYSDYYHELTKTLIPKPEGVGSELADVIIRVLDTCKRYNIDIQAKVTEKALFNTKRNFKHGGKKI